MLGGLSNISYKIEQNLAHFCQISSFDEGVRDCPSSLPLPMASCELIYDLFEVGVSLKVLILRAVPSFFESK